MGQPKKDPKVNSSSHRVVLALIDGEHYPSVVALNGLIGHHAFQFSRTSVYITNDSTWGRIFGTVH